MKVWGRSSLSTSRMRTIGNITGLLVCTHVGRYIHTYTHMHTHAYTCIHMHTYAVYVHTYTHKHVQTQNAYIHTPYRDTTHNTHILLAPVLAEVFPVDSGT